MGMVAGCIAMMVSLVPSAIRAIGLLLIAGSLLVLEGFDKSSNLIQNRRQVPQTIIASVSSFGPLQFGFEIGTAVRTFLPSSLPHVVLFALILMGNFPAGLIVGMGLSAGRIHTTVDHYRFSRNQQRLRSTILRHRSGQVVYAIAIAFLILVHVEMQMSWTLIS